MSLYMQFDRPMTEGELNPLRALLKRRAEGEPLQHLLGTVEFYRREFKTDSRALIPRPETEELVSIILGLPALVKKQPLPEPLSPLVNEDETDVAEPKDDGKLNILDMGTGSGVLGLSLAGELTDRYHEVTLADVSTEALSLAAENAELLGTPRHKLVETSLFNELKGEKYHLIAANLPYIAETDREKLSTEVHHDPDLALFGGKDGLDILRDFIQQAPSHMHSGGIIALEIGYDQADAVERMLSESGFKDITTHKDLNQIARFPVATLP